MGQRNMLCTRQMLDLESEQVRTQVHPDHYKFGNIADYRNQNTHPVISASGNTADHNLHPYTENHDRSIFHGNQFNSVQHHHPVSNLDLGGAAPSNFSYNPYMFPSSSSSFFNCNLNSGSAAHLPSSINHGAIGISMDEYGGNNHFVDSVAGPCKRKNAEVVLGNNYLINGSAASSLPSPYHCLNSELPQWGKPYESGVNPLEATVFAPPEYQGCGILPTTEGPHRSLRSRPSTICPQPEFAFVRHHNYMLQGNYIGHTFKPTNNTWVEQLGRNTDNGGFSNWNDPHPITYLHGASEVNMGVQGYQDTSSSRNSSYILHPPSLPNLHQHLLPAQSMQVQNYSHHTQLAAPSYRHPLNHLHSSIVNMSSSGLDSDSRFPQSFSSNAEQIHRPPRWQSYAGPELSHGSGRILSSEDAAALEFTGFYGVGNVIDQHRDMRLDIDDMSYEELLALEEQIGDVNTGLSEESILKDLKTSMYIPEAMCSPSDRLSRFAQENETCIICQVEFEENDRMGVLDCDHGYHADCIKQWLLLKSMCPICKKPAFG